MNIQENIESEITTLAKGAFVSTIGNISGRVLNVAAQIMIARALSPEFFGLYALGWVIMRLLSPFADFGVRRMITVYGPQFWLVDESRMQRVIKISFLLGVLVAFLLAVLLLVSSNQIAVLIFNNAQINPVIQAFAFILFFQTIMWIGESLTMVTLDMRYQVWTSDIIQPLTNFVLIAIFLRMGLGFDGVLKATIISFIIASIFSIIFVIMLFRKVFLAEFIKDPPISELITSSISGILPSLFLGILPWLNRLLLGVVRPVWDVGIFQAASQFSLLFSLIIMGVNSVLGPIIAKFNFSGDKQKELNEIYILTTKWIIYFALPISIVTFAVPKLIILVLFGENFVDGAIALQILTIGQIISLATGATGTLLVNSKHINSLSKTALIGLVITIIFTPLFSVSMGISGAAFAMALAYGVISIVTVIQVRRNLGIWPYDKRYWKGLLSAIISIVICSGLRILTHDLQSFWQLGIISIGTLVSFVLSLFLLGLDVEDNLVINLLMGKINILFGFTRKI